VRTISSVLATAQAMDHYIERPALATWMGELGQTGDVQEVEITSADLSGTPVRELSGRLPEGVLVALVARNGEVQVPNEEFELEPGDRITLIGDREAVREAMSFCHPE
jgi:Trk K+ transport system NAD-binding subunit